MRQYRFLDSGLGSAQTSLATYRAFLVPLFAAILPFACATTPAEVRQIQAAYPDATYETRVEGCDRHPPIMGRRFGRDLRAAVLWSRQVVGSSRLPACEVVISAVIQHEQRPVYYVSRSGSGMRSEGVLLP